MLCSDGRSAIKSGSPSSSWQPMQNGIIERFKRTYHERYSTVTCLKLLVTYVG
jgi:hypothetical protein